jgi:hypothetical protein
VSCDSRDEISGTESAVDDNIAGSICFCTDLPYNLAKQVEIQRLSSGMWRRVV